ncbi:MAG: hypothetical protein OXN93_02165 [bacterium]|nr:hypothetical protein [bacterium]
MIAETVPSVEWLDMPAGEGVAAPGWDGVVECPVGNQFVPAGRSVWELSTEQKGAHGKACDDYDKRKRNTPEAERAELNYVAVICAAWTKRRDFEAEKSRFNDFGTVRAMNVDMIEAWLACAPATTVWLREQIGEPVDGIETLLRWWTRWLGSTQVPLDAGVVLAGRKENAKKLRDFCQQGTGGVFMIGGNWHRDEVLSFVAAALTSDAVDGDRDVLYIEDRTTAQRLLAARGLEGAGRATSDSTGMIVVVPSPDFARYYQPDSGHRVIVPVPSSSQPNMVLEPVDSGEVASHLEAAGEHTYTAYDLGTLARMSLLTLRRSRAVDPALHRPTWAEGSIDVRLRRCLLLNSWKEDNESDRQLVEGFVGCSYEDVVEVLHGIVQENEPPMLLTEERRHVVAPADAWHLFAEQITRQDLDLFGCIAVELLSQPDPLDAATDIEHLRALVGEVGPRCSPVLRRGVATTLALLGSFPQQIHGDVVSAVNRATPLVYRIMRAANEDSGPGTWASVIQVLDLLAEADPDAVLEGLRTCLNGPHSAMFLNDRDRPRWFSHATPQQGVLNALRVLAWSADHLIGTVDVLARLVALDERSGLSNGPLRDLSWTMTTWMPQTSASGKTRLEALDMLRRQHSLVAWRFMLALLSSDSVPDRHGPRYRDWKKARPPITRSERLDMDTEIANRLIEDAGSSPERLKALIELVNSLPSEARNALHATLVCIADSGPSEDVRSAIWPPLRHMVDKHRSYSDTNWALPESELDRFAQVLERLRPSAPLDAYGWLFVNWVRSINGITPRDYEAYTEALEARRAEAVRATLETGGVAAVLELAVRVDNPRAVGTALARASSDMDTSMLAAMGDAPESVNQAALGYFTVRFREYEWEDLDGFLTQHSPSQRVTADLLRAIPPIKQPWRKGHELGADIAAEYWARVSFGDLGPPSDLVKLLEVCQRLRDAQRVYFAAEYLWIGKNNFGTDPRFGAETAACLEHLAKQGTGSELRKVLPDIYHLSDLMESLDYHRHHLGADRVAMLEWQYYPILEHEEDFNAPNLYRRMAREPEFFVCLVELVFRPATRPSEPGPDLSNADQQRAMKAWGLLQSWPSSQIVPGLDEDGVLHGERLKCWVDRVRRLLAESDRAGVGDGRIGAALAATPPGVDGEWPAPPVRDLIEQLNSDDIDSGIEIAMYNQRGVTSRSPTEGGDQERDLAETYRQKSQRFNGWPRLSAIFISLANSYEFDSARHDRSAETRQRGLSP